VQPSPTTRFAAFPRAPGLAAFVAAAAFGLGSGSIAAQEASAEAGQGKSTACLACHGADGNAIVSALNWPSLAGQHASYIVRQLEAFRTGNRADAGSGMQAMAMTLSEADSRDVAAWFASQAMAPKGADPAQVERGQRIYRGGIPERGVAACIACHGPDGQGNPLAGYPRVSHQHAAYLAKTLRDYRSGSRTSDAELNQMMRNTAEFLLDDEIDALASYMQGLH
jgi:cytochrome c553